MFVSDPFSRFSWDAESVDCGVEPDPISLSDSEDDLDETAEGAGAELVETLLSMYFDGKMSAKGVCTICFFACLAGAKSPDMERLALRPSAQSGKFSRKLDKYLGLDLHRKDCLRLSVPGLVKESSDRTVYTMPVRSPHEELVREWEGNPDLAVELERGKREEE